MQALIRDGDGWSQSTYAYILVHPVCEDGTWKEIRKKSSLCSQVEHHRVALCRPCSHSTADCLFLLRLKTSLLFLIWGKHLCNERELMMLMWQLHIRHHDSTVHVQEFLYTSKQVDEGIRSFLTRLQDDICYYNLTAEGEVCKKDLCYQVSMGICHSKCDLNPLPLFLCAIHIQCFIEVQPCNCKPL